MPAGTANLFATNLGIPSSIEGALDIAFNGRRATLDAGVVNGEHFAVMSGTGFDARMIGMVAVRRSVASVDVAYVWSGPEGCSSKADVDHRRRRRVDVVLG